MDTFIIERNLREIATKLSDDFNFSIPDCLEIVISNRLRSCNGTITWEKSRFDTSRLVFCKIVMSRALLDEFGWEAFETTFRHELAHLANIVLYNTKGHGESFKRLCQLLGGTMSKKKAGTKYADCASVSYVKVIIKWEYHCPCGYIKKMAKRMNRRKRGSKYYGCGKCKIHKLDTWKEVRVA